MVLNIKATLKPGSNKNFVEYQLDKCPGPLISDSTIPNRSEKLHHRSAPLPFIKHEPQPEFTKDFNHTFPNTIKIRARNMNVSDLNETILII